MTQAKAQVVASAMIAAGFKPHVVTSITNGVIDWLIFTSDDDGVAVNTLKTFQDNQGGIVISATTAIIK